MDLTRLGHRRARRRRDPRPRLRRARVAPGALFFCVRGATSTGTTSQATRSPRARSRSSSSGRSTLDVPQLVVPSVRAAMAPAAATLLRRPVARARRRGGHRARTARRRPRSCSQSILEAAGRRPALLTNIERRVGGERGATGLNTPEAIDLQRLLPRDARRGRPLVRDGGDVDRRARRGGSTARASRCSSSRT